MPVLKPRRRLVYFRASEDEYLQFSAMCQSVGARSLSALARTAMQRMLAAPTDEAQLTDKLHAFDELTKMLIERLRSIDELLEAAGHRESPSRAPEGPLGTPSLEQTNV